MCGIVGLFLKDRTLEPKLGDMLSDMLITMTDRGPDSAGIAIYGALIGRGEGEAVGPGRGRARARRERRLDHFALALLLRAGLRAGLGVTAQGRVGLRVDDDGAVLRSGRGRLGRALGERLLERGDHAAMHDHLRTGIALRLEQHGIHVAGRRRPAGQRLQGLGAADLAAIGARTMEIAALSRDVKAREGDISERVSSREADIEELLQAPEETDVEILPSSETDLDSEEEQRLDAIRKSVTDESVTAQFGDEGGSAPTEPTSPPQAPPVPEQPPATPAPQQHDVTDEGEQA